MSAAKRSPELPRPAEPYDYFTEARKELAPLTSITVSQPRQARGAGVFTTYTAYLCTATTADNETLTAHRRYTDFQTLVLAICKQYPALKDVLPSLPEKKVLGKFKSSFVEKRRAGLEAFLAAALTQQHAYRFLSWFLYRFLQHT
jgi:hypothetical protein